MNSHQWLGLAAVVLLGATVACSDDEPQNLTSSSTTTSGSGGDGGDSTSTNNGGSTSTMMASSGGNGGDGGSAPTNYPMGPYGNQENDTFPFLTWQGYLSTDPAALATTETWTDTYTSLDLMNSGASFALVHTTLSS